MPCNHSHTLNRTQDAFDAIFSKFNQATAFANARIVLKAGKTLSPVKRRFERKRKSVLVMSTYCRRDRRRGGGGFSKTYSSTSGDKPRSTFSTLLSGASGKIIWSPFCSSQNQGVGRPGTSSDRSLQFRRAGGL